jgi:hypothetical protein
MPLNVDEYIAVSNAADAAYLEALKTGVAPTNPHPENTEAFDIWATRMMDLPRINGQEADDFDVLGSAAKVSVVAENDDGSVSYEVHSTPQ